MQEPFFKSYGNIIELGDPGDLEKKLSEIDTSVPLRTDGRKSEDEERYSLAFYLKRLAAHNRIQFPVRVEKSERPDFKIISRNVLTGLEHTNAGSEEWHRQQTLYESAPQGSFLEPLPSDRLKSAVRLPGEPLIADGWGFGDAQEEWVKNMIAAIEKKTASINQESYEANYPVDLMIYDNTQVSWFFETGNQVYNNLSNLQQRTRATLSHMRQGRRFRHISVIFRRGLLFDVLSLGGIFWSK
jgi:hypothetical protein